MLTTYLKKSRGWEHYQKILVGNINFNIALSKLYISAGAWFSAPILQIFCQNFRFTFYALNMDDMEKVRKALFMFVDLVSN